MSPNQQYPSPTAATLRAAALEQTRKFQIYVLTLYHNDSHEKYFRWNEEQIALDLAYQCFIDGVFMDPFSDMEDHTVEICRLFARMRVWKESQRRVERVLGLIRDGGM
jgi:hypothetical protein